MKLADWAREVGLSYKTAYRLFKNGDLPIPSEQLHTGTILVHKMNVSTHNAVLYARVSAADQTDDLERQLQRLRDYAAANGIQIVQEVSEIGSGLNGHRKKLLKLLADPAVSIIVVEHRDRLVRFGFDYIATALHASHREIRVINDMECTNDLVQDMIDLLTSFCARLYGKRAAKNRAMRALEATKRAD